MRGAGLRIELMRFSLLVVLTVALLSVAFRIHSHPASSAHGRAPLPHASPSVPTHVLPSASTRPHVPSPAPSSSPGHPGGSGQGGGAGGSGSTAAGAGGPQTLPVTGWDATMKLGALAFLLIGGGALAVRVGAPRRPAAQSGQPTVQD